MSILKTDNIQAGYGQQTIPLAELEQRTVQSYYNSYTGGAYEPSTTYDWVPGLNVDFTPIRSDTRLRATLRFNFSFVNAVPILHLIFYANGVEIGRHNLGGQYQEQRHVYVWDIASWGAGVLGRIGYQSRRYGNSNRGKFHSTGYWNGTGSSQVGLTEYRIDEYIPI